MRFFFFFFFSSFFFPSQTPVADGSYRFRVLRDWLLRLRRDERRLVSALAALPHPSPRLRPLVGRGVAMAPVVALGEAHKLRWVDEAQSVRGALPRARGGTAAARFVLNDQDLVFLFGGCGDTSCYDDLMRFDQNENSWASLRTKNKPPSTRHDLGFNVLLDSRLYVWGGWHADGPVPSSLKYFDIHTGAWTVSAYAGTPPAARWAHTVTTINTEQMVVFGGEGVQNDRYYNDLHLFDATGEQWFPLHAEGAGASGKEFPAERLGHSATHVGAAIYIWGGCARPRAPPGIARAPPAAPRAPPAPARRFWVPRREPRPRLRPGTGTRRGPAAGAWRGTTCGCST
jgi:hypothetical protein